jgi:ribonuclease T2
MAMLTRRFALGFLAVLVLVLGIAAQAQRAPWPSEYFDPKPQEHVAGEFDYYTLVLSWSPTECTTSHGRRNDAQCTRRDGKRYGFLLHGLWPQYAQGYPERCRLRRRPFVPEVVIDSVRDVMPRRGLVIHEYRTHGTCSGLRPAEYYGLARRLFKAIRIPRRYQNPFEAQFVSPYQLKRELIALNPWLKPNMIAVTCTRHAKQLKGVRICFSKAGLPRACGRNEAQRRLCRAKNLRVPPVRSTRRKDGGGNAQSNDNKKHPPQPRVMEFQGNP